VDTGGVGSLRYPPLTLPPELGPAPFRPPPLTLAKRAAGNVLDAAADAGEEIAGGVIKSTAHACTETFDRIPLTCDETAEGGLGEPIAAPDHQVV